LPAKDFWEEERQRREVAVWHKTNGLKQSLPRRKEEGGTRRVTEGIHTKVFIIRIITFRLVTLATFLFNALRRETGQQVPAAPLPFSFGQSRLTAHASPSSFNP